MKFCTKCGEKIEEGNKFCMKCGQSVSKQVESPENTPPKPEVISEVQPSGDIQVL